MAIKKGGITIGMMGKELKKFLKAIEQEERSSIMLGETAGPLLDLYETADSIIIEVDVPGTDPDNIGVSYLHGFLSIEGMKRERAEEPGRMNFLCMERSFEAFKRIVKITTPINPKGGKASYVRGVLTIVFPKVEDQRGETIIIKVEKAQP